ncbi:MAG: prolyl oligopeptidase family serine peptidase, partial [Bacteroidota bacterium]
SRTLVSSNLRYAIFLLSGDHQNVFTMTKYQNKLYPVYETFKYPKVGENNAQISMHLFRVGDDEGQPIDVGDLTERYVPRVQWTQDPSEVCITTLNRHQNHLQLLIANTDDNTVRTLLEEKNKYYIDITNNLTFLKDGNHFIWTSEKDSYNHIYKYDMDGKQKCAITKGNYDVTAFYGVDEKNNKIYYQSAEESPLTRHIYEVNDKGLKKKKITKANGWNRCSFSSTYDYYTITHSTANSPNSYTVFDRSGEQIRVLEDNAEFAEKLQGYNLSPIEFYQFETSEGVSLNGYMIKPKDFDEAKEYPVFMFQYSGPGSQQVTDQWKGFNGMWFQMLAQQGFIIACVDPRGTGARGEEFKKMTYLELGKYETIDQIEAAKYLGSLSYVDEDRIGIFGWSYGGYMSSLCITKGADTFSTAIAVAPVTNWRWYDSIYTERYMRTEEENESGYRDNSPVYFANLLKGNYLLVHGGGDDNVHPQNTYEMANALIAADKQFDTYIYPNRNHGIYGGNTRFHLYTKMTDFLVEHLMP